VESGHYDFAVLATLAAATSSAVGLTLHTERRYGEREGGWPLDDDGDLLQRQDHEPDLLLYDFFKHLTSLAILILGGVLLLAQASDPQDVKRWMVIAVLLLISAGGVLSFSGSSEIVRARSTGTPVRTSIKWTRMLAPALLAVGVGMFLSMYADSLS
jgi:hypothetical protein